MADPQNPWQVVSETPAPPQQQPAGGGQDPWKVVSEAPAPAPSGTGQLANNDQSVFNNDPVTGKKILDVGKGIAKGVGQTASTVMSMIPGVSDYMKPAIDDANKPGGALDVQGPDQKIGAGLEAAAEFMLGDEALKGLSLADKIPLIGKAMKSLEEAPTLLKNVLAHMASTGARQATVGGVQTLAHGGSAGEALENAAITGGVGAATEGLLKGVEGKIQSRAPVTKAATELTPQAKTIAEAGKDVQASAEKVRADKGKEIGAARDAVNKSLPREPNYKYTPMDTSKPVSGDMYHGTKAAIKDVSEADPGTHGKVGAKYGLGLYLTDNPEVANGYAETKGAGTKGTIHKAALQDANLLDMEKPASPEVKSVFDNLQSRVPDAEPLKGNTTKELFDSLKQQMEEGGTTTSTATEMYQDLALDMKKLGYDGLRHEGGDTGAGKFGKHNVAILFPDFGAGKPLSEVVKASPGAVPTEFSKPAQLAFPSNGQAATTAKQVLSDIGSTKLGLKDPDMAEIKDLAQTLADGKTEDGKPLTYSPEEADAERRSLSAKIDALRGKADQGGNATALRHLTRLKQGFDADYFDMLEKNGDPAAAQNLRTLNKQYAGIMQNQTDSPAAKLLNKQSPEQIVTNIISGGKNSQTAVEELVKNLDDGGKKALADSVLKEMHSKATLPGGPNKGNVNMQGVQAALEKMGDTAKAVFGKDLPAIQQYTDAASDYQAKLEADAAKPSKLRKAITSGARLVGAGAGAPGGPLVAMAGEHIAGEITDALFQQGRSGAVRVGISPTEQIVLSPAEFAAKRPLVTKFLKGKISGNTAAMAAAYNALAGKKNDDSPDRGSL